MKNYLYISAFLVLSIIVYSCKKNDTDFRDFLAGKEIKYTGSVGDVTVLPGNLRASLKWKASSDPSITKYVIYFTNKADSQVVNVGVKTDTIRTFITGLQQDLDYSFTIYSFDKNGNKSVPKEINNVRVYGSNYKSELRNRPYNQDRPYQEYSAGSVILNFANPDTVNVKTVIRYSNNAGNTVTVELLPINNTIALPDYKLNTPIEYKSSYLPSKRAVDVVEVADFSIFPAYVATDVLCDRTLFKEAKQPGDVGVYDPNSTTVSKLWDGSVGPQGYPNIFHADGSSGMPHVLTFDLGKVYNDLSRIEETGRDCCNNPDQFEVWGRADLTNSTVTLPASNSGWPAEATAKGWILLKNFVRTDDGREAMSMTIDGAGKPIRYIRIRIKHVTTGDGNYSNMSEIRLWNKQ